MTKKALWLVIGAIAGFVGASCSSNTESEPSATQPTTTTTMTAAGNGTGTSTTAGGAGMGATAGGVTCGTAMCVNPLASGGLSFPGFSPATPCCADEAASTCGYIVGGTCTPPSPPAPLCPAPSIPMATACCVTASNTCGIDLGAVGMGCGTLPFGGGAPTMCDGTPVSTGAAGMMATMSGSAGTGAAGMTGAAGAAGSQTAAAGSGAAGNGGAAGAAGTTTSGAAGGSAGAAGN